MQNNEKMEGAQFIRWFGPLLDALRKLGGSGSPDEVVEWIAAGLNVSDEVQNELTPSGQPRFRNQVAWARFYLVREGLLDSSRRGVWSLNKKRPQHSLDARSSCGYFPALGCDLSRTAESVVECKADQPACSAVQTTSLKLARTHLFGEAFGR